MDAQTMRLASIILTSAPLLGQRSTILWAIAPRWKPSCPIVPLLLIWCFLLWHLVGNFRCSLWFEHRLVCDDYPRDFGLDVKASLPSQLCSLMESVPMTFISVLFNFINHILWLIATWWLNSELLIFNISKSVTHCPLLSHRHPQTCILSPYPAASVKYSPRSPLFWLTPLPGWRLSILPYRSLPSFLGTEEWSPGRLLIVGKAACKETLKPTTPKDSEFKKKQNQKTFFVMCLEPCCHDDFLKRFSTFHPDV